MRARTVADIRENLLPHLRDSGNFFVEKIQNYTSPKFLVMKAAAASGQLCRAMKFAGQIQVNALAC
jgi:hypothetical protein